MKKRTDKGGQIVWLAGLPLVLHYSINSLCAMEARAGMPLDRLLNHHFSATRLLQRGGALEDVIDACAKGLRASGLLDGEEEA